MCNISRGWLESRLFGCCLLLLLSRGLMDVLVNRSPSLAIHSLRDCWILGVAMLRRPHDVILLPVQIFASTVITRILHSRTMPLAVAHVWLGWVAYFYQVLVFFTSHVKNSTNVIIKFYNTYTFPV